MKFTFERYILNKREDTIVTHFLYKLYLKILSLSWEFNEWDFEWDLKNSFKVLWALCQQIHKMNISFGWIYDAQDTPGPFLQLYSSVWGFPVAQMAKNLPAIQEAWVWSLGQIDSLKEMTAHSRILAWRIPWTEESDRLQSMAWQIVGTQLRNFHLKTFNVFFALQTMQIVINNWPENYTNCKWQWICSDLDKTSQIQPWGLFPQD